MRLRRKQNQRKDGTDRLLLSAGAALLLTALLLTGCGQAQEASTAEDTAAADQTEEQTKDLTAEDAEPSNGIKPPVETEGIHIVSPTPSPEPEPTPTPVPDYKPSGTSQFYSSRADYPEMPDNMASENVSQSSKIQQIRNWYYATEALVPKLEAHEYDENFSGYWSAGELVRADVTERLDANSNDGAMVYHYYYHDGMPYFAYIEDLAALKPLRLYFWNGKLVRWIESDGVIHETQNENYAGYCEGAWRISQIMKDLEG